MKRIIKQVLKVIFLLFWSSLAYPDAPEEQEYFDLRVLIDVSGSMKKNDPRNLRIPALKLLVNLLPPDSRAGIWLFAENTLSLVPVARVDDNWKKTALDSSTKVHSRGLFTDIEKVIDIATEDWEKPDSKAKRSLILLTDGVVDVSKDPDDSLASKKRILRESIPRLQQLSTQVHTIALSRNADKNLLEKLSFSTDGASELVTTPAQLQRTFLKMFKKAVPRDSVPLVGNGFKIDDSIKEFSLLVFREASAKPTRLIGPDGNEVFRERMPANVKWQSEEGYDLITVTEPASGEWRFEARTDPDNEVLILTDLKLKVSELPNYINAKEPLEIVASLTEKNIPIARDDFLDMVEVKLVQTDELQRKRDWVIDRQSANYSQQLADTLTPGKQTFTLIANGKTFQRQMDHTLSVIENPLLVDLTKDTTVEPENLVITLTPDKTIVDLKTLQVDAMIANSAGQSQPVTFSQSNDVWILRLNTPPADERLVINIDASAKSLRGTELSPQLKPLIIDSAELAERFPEPVVEADEALPDPTIEETPVTDSAENPPMEEAPNNDANWLTTSIVAVAINLVLFVGGYFAYRSLKKREEINQLKLLEGLG